jgi:hypothetical protein
LLFREQDDDDDDVDADAQWIANRERRCENHHHHHSVSSASRTRTFRSSESGGGGGGLGDAERANARNPYETRATKRIIGDIIDDGARCGRTDDARGVGKFRRRVVAGSARGVPTETSDAVREDVDWERRVVGRRERDV